MSPSSLHSLEHPCSLHSLEHPWVWVFVVSEEESNQEGHDESQGGTPEEVAIVTKTSGVKWTKAESATPTSNRKRKKEEKEEEEEKEKDEVDDANEKPVKVKATKKKKKESVLKVETAVDNKEPWTTLVHKKPQPEWVAYNPKTMRPAPLEKSVKLLSWNVNGLRALLKEKGVQHEQGSLIARLAASEDFDVLCLQETKLQVTSSPLCML